MVNNPLLLSLLTKCEQKGFIRFFIHDIKESFIFKFLFTKPRIAQWFSYVEVVFQLIFHFFYPFLFLFLTCFFDLCECCSFVYFVHVLSLELLIFINTDAPRPNLIRHNLPFFPLLFLQVQIRLLCSLASVCS